MVTIPPALAAWCKTRGANPRRVVEIVVDQYAREAATLLLDKPAPPIRERLLAVLDNAAADSPERREEIEDWRAVINGETVAPLALDPTR